MNFPRKKRTYMIMNCLYAGWQNVVKRTNHLDDIVALRKDHVTAVFGKQDVTFYNDAGGVVWEVTYRACSFDDENRFVLINPGEGKIDLRFPDVGIIPVDRLENMPDRAFTRVRQILYQFIDLHKRPPAKTEFLDFLHARVQESRTILAEILARGDGFHWEVTQTLTSHGAGRKLVITPR